MEIKCISSAVIVISIFGALVILHVPVEGQSPLLPSPPDCGISHGTRLSSRPITKLNEHPWIALIQYKVGKNDKLVFLCSGSLINKRHVLTNAQCLTNMFGTPVRVRLGEYDTDKEEDCMNIRGSQYCSDAPQDVNVEESITHPDYAGYQKGLGFPEHDIGIIKLAADVQYGEFVRPICLPSRGTEWPAQGELLQIAGWGYSKYGGQTVNVKLKQLVPFIDHDECRKIYANSTTLGNGHICAGGGTNKETCTGGSGAPLMRLIGYYWVLEGITAFEKECGRVATPDVFTWVTGYLTWIEDNIKL